MERRGKWMLVAAVALCGIGATGTLSSCSSGGEGQTFKTDTVVIEQMEFRPATLTIRPGDTVVWINRGIVAHNVTEDTSATWTSGDIDVDSSWKMVPDGSFHYICSIHPTMKGSISVKKE